MRFTVQRGVVCREPNFRTGAQACEICRTQPGEASLPLYPESSEPRFGVVVLRLEDPQERQEFQNH